MEEINHEKIEEKAELFKILSNDVRLCILTNLCVNGEKKVNELQKCACTSQSFVSQQLMKLKYMGIIKDRKDGVEVYYSLCDEKVKEVIQKLVLDGE